MTTTEYIRKIKKMSMSELLSYILANPTDLTDSYYSVFGKAIHERAAELLKAEADRKPTEGASHV